MEYQGYKLLDKIMLVCRDKAEHEDSQGRNCGCSCYQAYLVDPSNKKQLESARYWAEWTEYGPQYKNDEGKWVRDYEIKHDPVEFTFDNNGFELELKDCAGGSSQGGKLSFWNCLVTKDNNTFKIGINSDMLLDLLKNATFVNGKCQSPLIFITQKGKVGMTVVDSDVYKQCIKDRDIKNTVKSNATSKFTFGDIIKTATLEEIYLGTITQYYKFDIDERNKSYYYRDFDYSTCTLTKLAKPVTYNMFDYNIKTLTRLSDFINYYNSRVYAFPELKKTCPKRIIDGKIDMDCSEEHFREQLSSAIYDYNAFAQYSEKNHYNKTKEDIVYRFISRDIFGFNFKPFELDSELLAKIKAAGIKYIEE